MAIELNALHCYVLASLLWVLQELQYFGKGRRRNASETGTAFPASDRYFFFLQTNVTHTPKFQLKWI